MVVVSLYCGISSTVADGLGVFSMDPPGIRVVNAEILRKFRNDDSLVC